MVPVPWSFNKWRHHNFTAIDVLSNFLILSRLQNSPYFCVFRYARAVKQKVRNKAENKIKISKAALFQTFCLTARVTWMRKNTDCFAV